jgi:hypothetical protein
MERAEAPERAALITDTYVSGGVDAFMEALPVEPGGRPETGRRLGAPRQLITEHDQTAALFDRQRSEGAAFDRSSP